MEENKDIVTGGETQFIQPSSRTPSQITFYQNGDMTLPPILELRANGDICVKGKIIENDIEVVDAMREFLKGAALLKK
jgi:hypothetical protein